MKRVVVKVGSIVLTQTGGKLNVTRVSALVDQIAWMRHHGFEVILVTSEPWHADGGNCPSTTNWTRWNSVNSTLPWGRSNW